MADQPKAEWVDALPDDEAAATAAYLRSHGGPDKDLEGDVERQEQYRKAYERRTAAWAAQQVGVPAQRSLGPECPC